MRQIPIPQKPGDLAIRRVLHAVAAQTRTLIPAQSIRSVAFCAVVGKHFRSRRNGVGLTGVRIDSLSVCFGNVPQPRSIGRHAKNQRKKRRQAAPIRLRKSR